MIISFFKDEWSTYSPIEMMQDVSWEELSNILTTFIEVPIKEQTEMYNLWEFKVDNNTIHRCKDDCVALHGLVLDYDKNLSLNDALMQFDGFECVFYTTFNHAPGNDRFRVVLPFTRPLTIDEFTVKRKAMIDAFPGVDRASFSRSQAIFLHSGPDISKSFACKMDGDFLNPDIFVDEVIEPITYTSVKRDVEPDNEFKAAYKNAIINSLSSCRGFRHLNSLSIVIMLKSCGATFDDYRSIVSIAGDRDSAIQDPKSQKEAWAAVEDTALIGRKKRDEFIAKFGGQPVVVKTYQSKFMTEFLNKYKEKENG